MFAWKLDFIPGPNSVLLQFRTFRAALAADVQLSNMYWADRDWRAGASGASSIFSES